MQEGRGMGILCIHIADSLCYTAETNTTLSSNYTPIKMLKKTQLFTRDTGSLGLLFSFQVIKVDSFTL